MRLLVYIILLLCFALTCSGQSFYEQINAERKRHHLKPLKPSVDLEDESQAWLTVMIKKYNGKLVHGPLKAKSYKGEVLGIGDEPFEQWMNSPMHKKVLLDKKFRYIGIAFEDGKACARLTD